MAQRRHKKALARLQARQTAFDNAAGIQKAQTLTPGAYTRPGSMNPRKGA